MGKDNLFGMMGAGIVESSRRESKMGMVSFIEDSMN